MLGGCKERMLVAGSLEAEGCWEAGRLLGSWEVAGMLAVSQLGFYGKEVRKKPKKSKKPKKNKNFHQKAVTVAQMKIL